MNKTVWNTEPKVFPTEHLTQRRDVWLPKAWQGGGGGHFGLPDANYSIRNR